MICPHCHKDIDVLGGYSVSEKPEELKTGVAQPKVYEYREKYLKRELSPRDLIAEQKIFHKGPRQDGELDKFTHDGDSLFFGDGLTEDF